MSPKSPLSRRLSLALVAASVFAAHAASAMPALTLTPFVGPSIPATRLAFPNSSGGTLILQLEPATMIGFDLGWRYSNRLAVQGTLGYARPELSLIAVSGNQLVDVDGAVVNTDAVVRWTVNRDPEKTRWELLAGAGAYRLRGSFADLLRAESASGIHVRARLEVITGLGASWDIGGGRTLRIEGRDCMHGPGIDPDPSSGVEGFSHAVQHDVSLTVGIGLPI